MTNLEKFYPGVKLEAFRREGSQLAYEPNDNDYAISCWECPACNFCDEDIEHKTCIDTFEAWAKKEYEELK